MDLRITHCLPHVFFSLRTDYGGGIAEEEPMIDLDKTDQISFIVASMNDKVKPSVANDNRTVSCFGLIKFN